MRVFSGPGSPATIDDARKMVESQDEHLPLTIRRIKDNRFIFSLTETWDDLLMWAHYAVSHTGVVVGFDVTPGCFDPDSVYTGRQLSKVRYSTHRPSYLILADVDVDEVLLTKSIEWAHEKEWRMFDSPRNAHGPATLPNCYPFRFQPNAVREVVVGARGSAGSCDCIAAVLRAEHYRHVELFRCVIDERQFRVRRVALQSTRRSSFLGPLILNRFRRRLRGIAAALTSTSPLISGSERAWRRKAPAATAASARTLGAHACRRRDAVMSRDWIDGRRQVSSPKNRSPALCVEVSLPDVALFLPFRCCAPQKVHPAPDP